MPSQRIQRSAEELLSAAAAAGWRGSRRGEGGPFGAVIVKNGSIIAAAWNTVLRTGVPTRHAEINAIEKACRRLGRAFLDDCEIYSSTEPCPMCFSAIHWARLRACTYATTIADVKALGFNELTVPATLMKRRGKSGVRLRRQANEACADLLRRWKALPTKKTY